MKRNASGRSAAGNSVRVLVLVAVALGAARLVVGAVEESNAGHTAALRQTLIFGGLTVGFVLLCVGGLALALVPSARRKATLTHRFPNSTVRNGRWNPDLVRFLSQRLVPGVTAANLVGAAFTFVADSTGLTFWIGTGTPRLVSEVSWHEFSDVVLSNLAISPIRTAPSVQLVALNGEKTAEIVVSGTGFLGAYPESAEGVQQVVGELDDLCKRARSVA
jgi:hypothetical protein